MHRAALKLLQVIPQLDAGGAERTTLEVAEAVIAAGGEALIASQGGRLERELAALGGELIRLPVASKNPFRILANAGALIDLCRRRRIDLIHARSRAPAWSALRAARRLSLPFVTTYHGTYAARSVLKRRYNAVMARGDRVIANSQFIADHVAAEHGVGPDRLRVIPRGVDLEHFDPDAITTERTDALRSGWGAQAGDAVILLPGRLTAWKGQGVAIDALAALNRSDLILVCAGDAQGRDAYRQSLIARAARAGVRLHLPGHVEDVPAALAAADIVLTPSIEPEAFGRATAEAMAMGRPVIAAAHGGALEIILPGETGWLSAPGDPAALAAQLAQALKARPDQIARMGAAGRARAAVRFSKTALQTATLRVYRELLE